MQLGTNGLRSKAMKRSTFGMRRSKGQGHVRPEIDLDAMAPPDIILNPLQSSRYSSSLLLELFLKNKTFTVWWLFFCCVSYDATMSVDERRTFWVVFAQFTSLVHVIVWSLPAFVVSSLLKYSQHFSYNVYINIARIPRSDRLLVTRTPHFTALPLRNN